MNNDLKRELYVPEKEREYEVGYNGRSMWYKEMI